MKTIRIALLLALGLLPALACSAIENFIQRDGRSGLVVDGEQSGAWLYSYPDGTHSAEGEYRRDRQFGPWTYWYPNGQKQWEVTFGEEAIEGPSTFYYQDGQEHAQGQFYSGYEEGLWRFWSETGSLEREGQYAAGIPEGRWTFFYPSGARRAEGFYFKGEPVAQWSFWDEAGAGYSKTFALPEDRFLIREGSAQGLLRREGLGSRKLRDGRWVSYHNSGQRRAQGTFRKGKQNGPWRFFTPDGALLSEGMMRDGEFWGRWKVREGAEFKRYTASRLETLEPFRGDWSRDDLAQVTSPVEAIAKWAAELDKPFSGSEVFSDPASRLNGGEPPADLAATVRASFELPIRPQPWTESELQAREYLAQRYSEGEAAATPPSGSKYAAQKRKPKSHADLKGYGDTDLANRLIGKPLPEHTLRTLQAQKCTLDPVTPGEPVVAVILRGVSREVCIYCVAQTEAILGEIDRFKEAGAEVAIIYPGPKSRLGAFVGLVEEELMQEKCFDDVRILYDPNMELVSDMRILDRQAIPTTIILDAEGIVRYAYVGFSIDDRPSNKDLLAALAKLTPPD